MRGFGADCANPKAAAFDTWLQQAITSTDTREQSLIEWERAPGARDAQPREDHLLPLMVAAGAASGEAAVVDFHGVALDKPISGFRLAEPSTRSTSAPQSNSNILVTEDIIYATLLVIESSPRGDHSMSRGLTQLFVEQ